MPMDAEDQAKYDAVVSEREDLKSKLKGANDEAKGHRLSSEAYRGQVEDFRSKWQSSTADIDTMKKSHGEELDRVKVDYGAQLTAAQRERDEAKAAASQRVVDADLRLAARDAGMVDLDALKLLDRAGIKLDDDGNVTNAADLLSALKDAKPYLFGEPPKPGTETGTTSSTAKRPGASTTKSTFDARTATKEEVDAELKKLSRPMR